MEDLTQEQVQSNISAAYDSVNLINALKAKDELTEQDIYTLDKNKQHISIMLAKAWFYNELTAEQKIELENTIQ